MSRNGKIITGIFGMLVVMCICMGVGGYFALQRVGDVFEESFITEPDEVAKVAERIVDYDLPAGYNEQFGMSFFGFDVVAFGSDGSAEKALIMLMQFPPNAGLSQEEMQKQMSQAMEGQNQGQPLELKPLEEQSVTIRDQEVTLNVSEGRDNEGLAIRQVSGVFEGKNGTVFLMITGAIERWDEGAVDEFIGSIR